MCYALPVQYLGVLLDLLVGTKLTLANNPGLSEAIQDYEQRLGSSQDNSWKPRKWTVGYQCDVQDQLGSPWCVGKVVEVDPMSQGQRFKIHYQGWVAKWDEWMVSSSTRLAPLRSRVGQ